MSPVSSFSLVFFVILFKFSTYEILTELENFFSYIHVYILYSPQTRHSLSDFSGFYVIYIEIIYDQIFLVDIFCKPPVDPYCYTYT